MPHWQKEIRTFGRDILNKAARQRGRLRPGAIDKYLKGIIDVTGGELEDMLPSPIIIINPCLTNYYLCHGAPNNGPA